MNRREAILCTAALGLGAIVPTTIFAQTQPKLLFPPLIDATETHQFSLTAQSGTTRFGSGAETQTAGFNQSYLGPTVRLSTNADTQAEVQNQLSDPVSAHWHGLIIPGDADGGPHQAIQSGEAWRPVLALDQPPATAWYHSHVHGAIARQVMFGLAGVLHVTDGDDDVRGLPSAYGIDDLTLVLQDRDFDWRGRIKYSPGMHETMNGFKGDTLLINGQLDAFAAVPQGIVRCRLVNGSNARIYRLSLSDSRSMHLIATDGGFLDRPVETNRLTLAPGERCEVLIDFNDGIDCAFMSDDVPNSAMGGMMGGGGSGATFSVLPMRVDPSLPVRIDTLPDGLDGQMPDLAGIDAPVRQLSLDMPMGMMMSRSGEQFAINGRSFDQAAIDFSVRQGEVERWIVRANTMMHPFHIHGVRFQVISENGQPPRTENMGWKDTVLVNGQVELAMKFERTASASAPYMYHCHILEHEDGGMMGQFSVE